MQKLDYVICVLVSPPLYLDLSWGQVLDFLKYSNVGSLSMDCLEDQLNSKSESVPSESCPDAVNQIEFSPKPGRVCVRESER